MLSVIVGVFTVLIRTVEVIKSVQFVLNVTQSTTQSINSIYRVQLLVPDIYLGM